MRLSELRTGEKGIIIKVLGHGGFRKRIVEMGFIKGKTVEVVLNAPLKDPVKYRIMGYEVSLRRQEASMIEVVSEESIAHSSRLSSPLQGIAEQIVLDENAMKQAVLGKRRTINVALVGNPNCGKTSLFNLASGAHEHVGNYSGVTVDAKEGFFDFEGYRFKLVDLPGTYSLSAYTPEELYVRRHIINETPDVIINVVDSSNLERNLYLTTQLIDMNVRLVVALNIYDELEAGGNKLDHKLLGQLLGIPMIPTVSKRGQGIEALFHAVINLYEGGDYLDQNGNLHPEVLSELTEWHNSLEHSEEHTHGHIADYVQGDKSTRFYRHIHINHGPELEKAIESVKILIAQNESIRDKYSTRFLSIKLLENDPEIENLIRSLPNGEEIMEARNQGSAQIRKHLNEESESAIIDAKYGFISGALRETFTEGKMGKGMATKLIDSVITHRIWGFPIFFLLMLLMFEATFVLGAIPMIGIEWLVEKLTGLVESSMTDGPLKDLLIDGVIGGVGGVIVFLPNILILYLCISLMEDSGYMARAAFIMDKVMHKMGLHGKSFIPLVMGFGCNVPAVMATRTIENRKSRLITMLINPLMSCSARLPVYLLLIGAFFPKHGGLVLFSIYIIGILLAVLMARFFNRHLVTGDDTPFVMELPPYRMPTAKSIARHTWEKGAQYLKKMGGIILVASILVWFLGYFPRTETYETVAEHQEHSYIGQIGKAVEPIMRPLGFDWKQSVGLVAGLPAKELIVSTLGVLYTGDDNIESTHLSERIDITPLVAFCYMIFVLLYFPCIATLVAIKQESGSWKWAVFSALYTTALAWITAFIIHQIGLLIL